MLNKKTIIAFTAILLGMIATAYSQNLDYYYDNSFAQKPNTWKCSIMSNSSYGLNEKMSINFNSIFFPISPSCELKYNHISSNELALSSMAGFHYPVLMMNIMRGKGAGGIISPEFHIPQMVSFRAGEQFSYSFSDYIISAKAMFEFSLKSEMIDEGTTVDLPMIAPQLAIYYRDIGFNFSLSKEYKLSKYFNLFLIEKIYLYPVTLAGAEKRYHLAQNQTFFFEANPGIVWKITDQSKLAIAGSLCYGNYSFGQMWHLLPFIDFQFYINQ